MRRHPIVSALTGLVLALGGLVPIALAAPAHAAARSVTLVGDLQSEAGCPADWQPDCTATDLVMASGTTTYARDLAVGAGSWNVKVAIDHSWSESYGANGGGDNVTFTLDAPATLRFTYDDTTHRVGVAPTDLPGATTAGDTSLAQDSLRTPLTRERFTSSWPTASPTATPPTTRAG